MTTTKLQDLINPQVMADMVSAKLPKKIRVAPIAKIDTTLVGQPGDTITIPSFEYIGDAEDVAEGVEAGVTKLTSTSKSAKVKKAMKAVELTDEAVLSGYGNPVGEANSQLATSIAAKIDNDCMEALLGANTKTFDGSASVIKYAGIVDAIDLFEEEENTEKIMYINPKQVTTLRKDPEFISADKYPGYTIVSGEIGKICNTRVVPSKKVTLDDTSAFYTCPIVKMTQDEETEEEAAALTIFLKRDVNLETERNTLARKTIASVDEHYVAAVTNASKIVLAKFKK